MGRHSAPDDEDDGDVLIAEPVESRPSPSGRHARSDDEGRPDDEQTEPAAEQVTEQGTVPIAVAEPAAEQVTEPGTVPIAVAEPGPSTSAATQPAGASQPTAASPSVDVGKGNQSTAADLALLRSRSDVRNRVVAGVVAPFVIYTLVMYVIGAFGMYFIWVWLPLVSAGILGGSILDAAHRKRNRGPGSG